MVKKEDKKVEGVSGWLLFFVVASIIAIVLPLYFGIRVIIRFLLAEPISSLGILFSILLVSRWVMIVNYLVLIFNKLKSAPKWTIIGLWFYFVVGLVLEWISYKLYGQIGSASFFNLIWCAIWTIYFVRSKRVKNTFIK